MLAGLAVNLLWVSSAKALESETAVEASVAQPAQAKTAPAMKLSWGAADVLKLSRAGVNDEVIQAYIKNSSRGFELTAAEIVYLRGEGVSNPTITTMLNQRATAPVQPAAPAREPAAVAPQYTATYAQPAPAQVVAAPAPSSTVYVIPNTAAYSSYAYYPYYYPSYYPYYGSYYRFGYPSISVGFGFGRGYWGGYRGGYGHWGGGYHGGGWGGHGGGHTGGLVPVHRR